MKVAVDYKGKHFCIIDEDRVDELDIILPYIDIGKVIDEHLHQHVADSLYYGVPAYIGDDEELKERIAKIEEEIYETN